MPSGKEFLPYNDDALVTWTTQFSAALDSLAATLGIKESQQEAITNANSALASAIAARAAADAAAKSATQALALSHSTLEDALRVLVRQIQANPQTTDAMRASLGITVPVKTRTRKPVGPEIPALALDTRPGQVVVHFGTDPTNEQTNGKPEWALGCNIYRKKATDTAFVLIAFDTASPYIDHIAGAAIDVSYKAAYRGTGANDEGGVSPSQTVAAGG